MKLPFKILLTIPAILSLLYALAMWFPEDFIWLMPTMTVYKIESTILNVIVISQLIILIKKLRSFKNIDKSIRTKWTWLLILFNIITAPIFIWKKMDEIEELNNTLSKTD